MDIIKKLFSGDKLSVYEKEQKRRYKQYVKLGTTNTIVMSKTESEIYQDYLIRRSLRRSKRKAAAAKLQKQDDMFKDADSNPGLSAAPAVLDAINRNVSIANVPNEYLNDLKQMETVTVHTHILNTHDKEKRRHSSVSEQGEVNNHTEVYSKRNTQPLDQKFAYGNQDMFLDQLDEVIRKRSRGHSLENIPHSSQTPIYENVNNVTEPSPAILAVKPRKKVTQNNVEAKRNSENIEQYTPKEQAQINEIATVTHMIHTPSQIDSSIDYYQSESEEIVWGTPPSNTLLPISRSSSCITTQSEDSFFDCISEDDDIYDDEEKIVMKQISPPFIKQKVPYHESETDFRSLGSEDELDQIHVPPPQYETIIKEEQPLENQSKNDVLTNNKSEDDKIDNSNLLDDSIEPDSLELPITNDNTVNSMNFTTHVYAVSPELKMRQEEEIEPEKETNTRNITSWAEKFRIKEREFASDEKSKEQVHQQEEVLIHDEALVLDDGFSNSELLKPQKIRVTNKTELIKLENNNNYDDSDTDSDPDNFRTDGKKVTFDFGKSYCQTYEVENSTEEEEFEELRAHSFRRSDRNLFEPDHYSNTAPTDDRSKVFLSYGVQPTPTQKEDILDKTFEMSINMDLAFLNCMDGFNSKLLHSKPQNITITELNEQCSVQNQDLDSKQNIDSPNEDILESVQDQKEFLLHDKENVINDIEKTGENLEVLERNLLSKSIPYSSTTKINTELVNKVGPSSTHDSPSNTPPNILRESPTPLIEVESENILTQNNPSYNDICQDMKDNNESMLVPRLSENWQSPYSDVIINRNSANILDDSISTISESGEILKPRKISEEVNQDNLSDDFGYTNDIDGLTVEQDTADYCEAINLVLAEGQISNEGSGADIESPASSVQPFSLEILTNVNQSETARDFVKQQLKISEQSDLKVPLDDRTLDSFSPSLPTPKLVRWESDSYIPEYKPVFENKQEEFNIINKQSLNDKSTTNINDDNNDNTASSGKPPNSVSYNTLSRSTSAPQNDKYKTKRAMIYSNRNIFTNNARKPIQRSISHSFGYAVISPTVNNRYSADYKESHNTSAMKNKTNKNEENDSLIDIQRRLSAVRNIESPEKQLITIQELLGELKDKANLLESKTDDEYVRLLQTLFKSIRIVSGLQCNFDQELLVSQQNTLKEIKDCISDLNAKL